MMKVLVIIPTNGSVDNRCIESVMNQDYSNFSILINVIKAEVKCRKDITVNSTKNRNIARDMALKTDADCFLWVDSDEVLPKGAITEFVTQQKQAGFHIIGGWYKIRKSPFWVAGRWVADNTFLHCLKPVPSVTKTDMVGLGCMFISRQALNDIEFRDGTNKEANVVNAGKCYLGPCCQFGNDAFEKGYQMYMDGNVICKHLNRRKEGESWISMLKEMSMRVSRFRIPFGLSRLQKSEPAIP